MNNSRRNAAVAAAAMAALGLGALVHDRYQDLRDSRAAAAAAWLEIGAIHAARERTAHTTLGRLQALPAPAVEKTRAMLSQVRAVPAELALLDDPMALDTYKRYQGELTGALFTLAFGAPALQDLQSSLTRNEAALAQARLRYRQAALKHNANATTLPGGLVGKLTGKGPVPPKL